jgi:PAS domain S-box-containing protein
VKKQKSNPEDAARLRQRAEKNLKQLKSQTNKAVSEADMLKLIHELQVHQIELELQNEELVIAKEKAEESEKKYRLLTEFAADVVWVLNLTTEKFTYISPSIFQLRGYTVEEAMNETLEDALTTESLKIVKDAIIKNTTYFIEHPGTKKHYINEIQQTCKNGQIIWVEVSTKFRYSPTGDIEVVGVSRNIDGRKRTEEALRKEKAFQGALLDLTKGFLNISLADFDIVIEDMLGKAGEFSKVDRVYLFMHDHLRRVTSNTHEWCKEGITPEKDNLQEIPFDFFSDMLETWEKGKMVHIPSVAQMSEEHAMRAILENQGIQSLVLIPLIQKKKNIGFIGFDAVNQCKSFSEREIALLFVMAEIISNTFARKQTEEELRKSKELLSETESIGKVGGWSFNIDTMVQKWTDEVYRIHEVEISPNPCVDAGIKYYTTESRPIIEKAVQRAIEHGENYDLELEIITAKGNTRAVHTVGISDLKNRRIYGFFQDITERKQAENELRFQNILLKTQQEVSLDGILIVDENGKIISFNQRFADIWEIPDEIMAMQSSEKTLQFVLPKLTNPDEFSQQIHYLYKNKNKKSYDELFLSDGKILERYSSPLIGSDDVYYGRIWYYRDITERKQAEKELIKAKEKAEESDRLKTAFINNISHEVRTPLNGILGFGHLIMEEGLSEKEKQEYYKVLRDSSKRLQDTISDIMDISQLTADSIKPSPAGVHLGQLMNNMLETTQLACAKRNILVTLKSPEQYDNLVLQTDGELLSKTLSHLLNNAEKFTSEGRITLGFEVKSKWVEFFVSDTGKGIAADKLDAVFEPFMQEDASVTRGHEGSGLGLTIARHVAELLGGKLWAESENGKGSTFFFSLPFVTAESKPEQAEDIAVKPTVAGKTLVLIAEDEESSYLLMKTMVQKAGFVSLHAFNGAEAVELCREYPEIGLILMDIKMPVMDGLEATTRIKAFRPDLPVIALTAHAQIGDRQRILDAGCDEYMAKPVKLEALNALIKRIIP